MTTRARRQQRRCNDVCVRTTFCSSDARRATRTRLTPRAAYCRAISAPMPLLVPVMSTTRPDPVTSSAGRRGNNKERHRTHFAKTGWRSNGCTLLHSECAPSTLLTHPTRYDGHYNVAAWGRGARAKRAGYGQPDKVLATFRPRPHTRAMAAVTHRGRRLDKHMHHFRIVVCNATGKRGSW